MLRIAEWGLQIVVLWVVAGLYARGANFDTASYFHRVSIVSLWTALLLAGGYMLNTFTDRHADALESDRASTHPALVLTLSLAFIVAGLFAMWRFEPSTAVRCIAFAQVAVLFAYTVPGPRLKERGWAGLVAAAVFQRVPGFLAVVLAFRVDGARALALVVWLIVLGFLFIMEHQIEDFATDRRAAVRTWAARVGIERARVATRRAYRWFGLASVGCAVVLAVTGDGAASLFAALGLLGFGAATVALFRLRYASSTG